MLINQFLLLGAVLFCIGVYGVLARRNAVLVLMSIELILNSVNINLIAFALRAGNRDGPGLRPVHHRRRGRRGRRRASPWCCSSTATVAASRSTTSATKADPTMGEGSRPGPGWFLDHAWLIPVIPASASSSSSCSASACRRRAPRSASPPSASSFVLALRDRDPVDPAGRGRRRRAAEGALGAVRQHRPVGRPGRGREARRPRTVVPPVIRSGRGGSRRHQVQLGTHIDGLAVAVLLVVTIISLLVHIFSTEYMRGDIRFTHYFAFLTLFTAGMLSLVVAENTIQLLLGWEIMGLCSFALIGHWWEEQANSDAALKAFFTTRTGDVGLLVGISILFFAPGAQSTWQRRLLDHRQHAGRSSGTLANRPPLGRRRAVHRRHRQERPVPAAHLAPRRHGRPDAGVRPHPRRHHGRGRRLPRRPPLPRVLGGLQHRRRRAQPDGAHRRHHDHHRRRARLRADRHQEGAGLLHGQPARLHGDGPRRRRVDGGRVPHLHPRLLQGLPLPRRRLDQPLGLAPLLRHEEGHGWPAEVHADHVRHVHHRHPRPWACPPLAGFWSKDEIIANAGRNGYTCS